MAVAAGVALIAAAATAAIVLGTRGETAQTAPREDDLRVFMAKIVSEVVHNDYTHAWESLNPEHQRVAPQPEYVACERLNPIKLALNKVRDRVDLQPLVRDAGAGSAGARQGDQGRDHARQPGDRGARTIDARVPRGCGGIALDMGPPGDGVRGLPQRQLRLSRALAGWGSTQAVLPDGAIEVEQRASLPGRVVEHSQAGARRLGAVYWREVRALTLGLVRCQDYGDGVELRALGVALFAFERAETHVTDNEVCCAFAIPGGLLARRPGGSLTLAQEAAGPVIRSTITGYSPRLAARDGPAAVDGRALQPGPGAASPRGQPALLPDS